MDDDPKFNSPLGCIMHFTLMAGVTWMVIVGTGFLIWSRWCKP